jgi:hypothetical protein
MGHVERDVIDNVDSAVASVEALVNPAGLQVWLR